MKPEDILIPNESVLSAVPDVEWPSVVQSFENPLDIDKQIEMIFSVSSSWCAEPIAQAEDAEIITASPIAAWALAEVKHANAVKISKLQLHYFLASLDQSTDYGDEINTLNHAGYSRAYAWYVLDPLRALDHVSAALKISDRHGWRGLDFDLATIAFATAVATFDSPGSHKADPIIRRWQHRLTHAITSAHPDAAYSQLQHLNAWKGQNSENPAGNFGDQ